jgi:hypothetical protein
VANNAMTSNLNQSLSENSLMSTIFRALQDTNFTKKSKNCGGFSISIKIIRVAFF